MRGNEHISLDELASWACDDPDLDDREWLSSHLESGCTQCAEGLRWIRWVLGSARADHLATPPPAVVQRAVAIFNRAPEPRSSLQQGLRRLLGLLVFDSHGSQGLAYARGNGPTDRQTLYAIPELGLEIDLLVQRDMESKAGTVCHLVGQLVAAGNTSAMPSPLRVVVRSDDGSEAVGVTHATGEFAVDYRSGGQPSLLVWTDQDEIMLPVLEP